MVRGREQPPSWARHALSDPESGVIQLLAATHFFGPSFVTREPNGRSGWPTLNPN
jgi:hypothetical protein